MKAIDLHTTNKLKIRFEKITPFVNYCKVTGKKELCNIVTEYIPNTKVLEITEYRNFFNREFNELIENIAIIAFEEILKTIEPLYLKVTVFLEGNTNLSDWSVTIESNK